MYKTTTNAQVMKNEQVYTLWEMKKTVLKEILIGTWNRSCMSRVFCFPVWCRNSVSAVFHWSLFPCLFLLFPEWKRNKGKEEKSENEIMLLRAWTYHVFWFSFMHWLYNQSWSLIQKSLNSLADFLRSLPWKYVFSKLIIVTL